MKSRTLSVESDSSSKFTVNLPSIFFHFHVFTFSNGDQAFGILTVTLPFLPSIVATAVERKCKTFFKHLPVVQLWTHQEMLRRITTLQNDLAQWKTLLTCLKDDNSMTKHLAYDIRNWLSKVNYDRNWIRGNPATVEFCMNWKKRLVEAGNVETDGIDWSTYHYLDVAILNAWNSWEQNFRNSKHDQNQMIQLFCNMIGRYDQTISEAKTELQTFKIYAGMLESAPHTCRPAFS